MSLLVSSAKGQGTPAYSRAVCRELCVGQRRRMVVGGRWLGMVKMGWDEDVVVVGGGRESRSRWGVEETGMVEREDNEE